MVMLQCDEHIDKPLWKALNARGIVTYRVEDENLKGMSDIDLLHYCGEKRRVLLTCDRDFFPLARQINHPGIIFLTDQQAPLSEIVRSILFLLVTVAEAEFENSIFYVPLKLN